jgi:NAD+ synthase
MSGGVDSSVAAWLAVSALGPEKVFGLILPDSSVTSKEDTRDAEKLAKNKLLRYLPKNKLARANFLVRLRMSILYYYAALMNRLAYPTCFKETKQFFALLLIFIKPFHENITINIS